FVICAGSVLFREDEQGRGWQMCILQSSKAEYVLPKGRKDCGESIEKAAVRETYEETGYHCELLPCKMTTRAPEPNMNMRDAPRDAQNATEPFAITVRSLGGEKGTKIVFWFLTIAKDVPKEEGTQTDSEDYHSEFVDAREAVGKLTFQDDQDIARKALSLI
ncbi:hypothetical protein HYDPIDRAFT_71244, partial [Hydnomerulius pinastri MD-312]